MSGTLRLYPFPGAEYLSLRRTWEAGGGVDLTAAALQPPLLTETQRRYVEPARTVAWLFDTLEAPFRRYVTNERVKAPGKRVWTHEAWDVVAAYRPAMLRLRDLGSATPDSWQGVAEWSATLAASRGGEPVTIDNAPTAYSKAQAPAMSLAAVSALFDDGFLDEGHTSSVAFRAEPVES